MIACPNYVWAMAITGIPMTRDFAFLEEVEEEIQHYGTPEILNADQGRCFEFYNRRIRIRVLAA